jgi:hypothetical protein
MTIERLVLAVLLAGATACPGPGLPPVSNCTPEDTRCGEAGPEVCSPTHRWTPANPEPCGDGEACCAVDAGAGVMTHICAPEGECR